MYHNVHFFFTDVAGVAATIHGASSAKLTPAEVKNKMFSDSVYLDSYKGYSQYLVTTINSCGKSRSPTPPPTPRPTSANCKILKVTVKTDNYPDETTWTVTNKCGSATQVVMSGGPYTGKLTTYTQQQCEYGRFDFTIKVRDEITHAYLLIDFSLKLISSFLFLCISIRILMVTVFAVHMVPGVTELITVVSLSQVEAHLEAAQRLPLVHANHQRLIRHQMRLLQLSTQPRLLQLSNQRHLHLLVSQQINQRLVNQQLNQQRNRLVNLQTNQQRNQFEAVRAVNPYVSPKNRPESIFLGNTPPFARAPLT